MTIGFAELLTLILVVAKLTHYVAWSWWWVFSPIIFLYSFVIGCFLFAAAVTIWSATR